MYPTEDRLKPIWLGPEIGAQFLPIEGVITIDLPGAKVDISSEDPGAIFNRSYSDLKTLLAAHRFRLGATRGTRNKCQLG